ncbi:hypothetical protein QN277_001396 [Acacia crassicarpa]|uniref:U-box domain-containing protein n=1 Tax=Acacia crassicarpa TaxID=499986 RepID=A0AAE1TIA6_9FABA|nr:hypothetical protein QN277_001396 [Acacia crassicarpa]
MSVNLEPLDLGVPIPYHFRCPISFDLMHEPVTIPTGQTYDRTSIQSWFAAGNTTCPITRAPLPDFTLIPNHTLRRLIRDWCVSNRAFGVEQIPSPTRPVHPSLARTLLDQASSETCTSQSCLSALRRLRRLASDSKNNHSLIGSYNVRRILLHILFDTNSDCFELKHDSLALLVCFSLVEPECVSIASEPERIKYLSHLMFHSLIEVRLNSAALIESVVSGTRSPELHAQISNVDEIYGGVVDMLKSPVLFPRALKIGIKALFAL